ncbi:MAG TPA: glycosyltransferase family 39 protein [Solirubrobacterales bacterium]
MKRTILVGLAVGALVALLTIPFLGRYGWDRDELYFLTASHHLALGYVDFPPLIALLAWLVHAVFGDSLDALRLTSLACAIGSVVLVALMARELGGGIRVQAGAALAWGITPYVLGSASIFHPTWLDLLAWSAFLYVALLILVRGEPRLWPLLGIVAGLGLEAKYTIAALGIAFALGLCLSPARRLLRTPGPWLALAIALLLLGPNLIWQVDHDWPSLHFIGSQNNTTAEDTSRVEFTLQQFLFLGAAFVVGVAGVVRLWRDPRLRALAIVPVATTLLYFLSRGRSYYPLPADSIAVAAGAVAVAGWLRHGRRRSWALAGLVVLQLAVLAVVAPIVVPVLPTRTMISKGIWEASFYDDEIGWPEFATETARAWRQLPPAQRRETAVVVGNYGEASALELYGPALGLPPPLSGHLSWQYWRPAHLPQRRALLIGLDPSRVAALCASRRLLGRIGNRYHLANDEQGEEILECRLRAPLGALWGEISTDRL